MPFGIPSEDFHGGLGLPYNEDDYDPYTGKYAFVSPDDETGGEIYELNDEKDRLIFALKETVEWLDYFLTTESEDIYYDEANEARRHAEYLLMELEDAE